MKTFGGWHDHQQPDGTITWTSPRGQTYTTHPGSRLLFPSLCKPTAAVAAVEVSTDALNAEARALKMPRRKRTRAENRARAIADERQRNAACIAERMAERNKPPPF